MARSILIGSSVVLAVLGLVCLFVPDAVASALSMPEGAGEALPFAASGLVGFAAMNWTGRGAIYGGIYGKPIVLGNWTTSVVLTLTLLGWQLDEPTALGWVVIGVLGVYAAAFTRLQFFPPFEEDMTPS